MIFDKSHPWEWYIYQWLFLVPLKGGRWHIIPQLAVYTTYIFPSRGLYATDPTFYGNQKQALNLPPLPSQKTNRTTPPEEVAETPQKERQTSSKKRHFQGRLLMVQKSGEHLRAPVES